MVRDTDGNEYTTFREAIGDQLQNLEGRRAQIEYHREKRGQYTNVYLDQVDPIESGHNKTGRLRSSSRL